ncbi:hypothetical protein BBP40_010215 [Aspergillus hancockii]|nr:hypothetical protein BBP40_010215 [Aspergillus hancockii]
MTKNAQSPGSSVSERRGQILAPLQTNFSRPTARPSVVATRPTRPRPDEYQNHGEAGERVPLQTPVKRQSSKSGLRSIFSRERLPHKESNDSTLSGIEESQDSAPQTAAKPSVPASPTLATPKTTFSTPTVVTSPIAEPQRAPKTSKSRQKSSEDKAAAGELGWKPPPLFQAYPQAIKHDSLLVPSLSADSILRVQATSSAKLSSARDESGSTDNAAARKKESKEKKKHIRSLSETIGKTEWSEKIYVLVTTGYILQYAGSGKYDRLPEKMLQVSDENTTAPTDTHRNLLSRLGFHRSHARRLTRSLLLVFSAPEDMSSWLLAVRAQIEARGGKKYVSEKAVDDDTVHQLESKPSIRQLVRKDPNRFSQAFLQPQPAFAADDKDPSDQSRRILPVLDGPPRSPTFSSPKQHESMYSSNTPTIAETSNHPQSQATVPDPILRSASPPAPNFSVPSFSKRFTARMGQVQMPHMGLFPSVRRDEAPTDPADTISSFPSPPQSPIKSISSVAMCEAHDQIGAFRDSPKRKSLRMANSEDSLAESKNQDPRLQHASRISNNFAATSTASQSSRPPSIVEHEPTHPYSKSPTDWTNDTSQEYAWAFSWATGITSS